MQTNSWATRNFRSQSLAKPDGTPINRVENISGKLKVADVEKLVDSRNEACAKAAVDGQLKDAAAKVKAGR